VLALKAAEAPQNFAAELERSYIDGHQARFLFAADRLGLAVASGGVTLLSRDTLRRIGVSETELIRQCDASFKQGSKFERWVDGRELDYYFHPFMIPEGYLETNLVAGWASLFHQRSHGHGVGVVGATVIGRRGVHRARQVERGRRARFARQPRETRRTG